MSCARYAAALRDHAIGAPLDRAAEAHLAACAACRARLESDSRAMASLDDELAAAFAIEPSPEFNAHVRVRVARQPVSVPFWHRPLVLALAASAVIAIGFAVLQVSQREAPGRTTAPRQDVFLNREEPRTTPIVDGARKQERAPEPQQRGHRPAGVERVATHRPVEPAVIVPEDRAAAIQRYVNAVAQGRVTIPEGALPKAAPPSAEIAPLTVEPIAIPASESATSKTTNPGL